MDPSFQERIPVSGWERYCFDSLTKYLGDGLENLTHGLTDKFGRPIFSLDNRTWGIDIETCNAYCSSDSLPWPNFNFSSFSSAFTNYLLPWLALTAQLPYETGSPWSDIMSLCLAVGSPALLGFSLTITMLNRYWVRRELNLLIGSLRRETRKRYKRQINAVQYFLAEAQQVPLQVPSDQDSLRRLLEPQMEVWWQGLNGRLRRSRRGVTASLVAQALSAVIAYTFTVIASFLTSIDSLDPVMEITAGTLWVWLIPVICGWVIVGTQSTHDAVEDALRIKHFDHSAEPQGDSDHQEPSFDGEESPISIRSNWNSNHSCWLGVNFAGDELQKGPVYNYARLFTWWQTANAFIQTSKSIALEHDAETEASWQTDRISKRKGSQVLNMVSESEISEIRIIHSERFATYPRFSNIPPDVWWRMVLASIMAVTVQWGATGASILMAYLTPPGGLGCRSGSYALYGIFGTISWVALLVSMVLSHAAMARPASPYGPALLGRMAIMLRCGGRAVAVMNAAWLVVSTLFENIGLYDSCWCHGVVLQRGGNAWVILFRTVEEFRHEAKNAWPGGIAFTMIVSTLMIVVFALGSKGDSSSSDDEYE
ncbi:uncharacterized protein CIMG_07749 [Coccidioides immitis RS]|uniref:Uncharacterized protein n=3 Tax=Coccidioides immitis TaxID=5501 RepID=A0A0E1S0S8_COCIM|nr:uncharacterized protein CIMG_07749 [Coccidioides immitis RS]EAS29003.2 hypothetical protein CIMG_07749 [Coccidioides immitis RS]KMP06128.1 hypothetical protein CIRG_05809 [Coccidioides immitis RMSCC 2394]